MNISNNRVQEAISNARSMDSGTDLINIGLFCRFLDSAVNKWQVDTFSITIDQTHLYFATKCYPARIFGRLWANERMNLAEFLCETSQYMSTSILEVGTLYQKQFKLQTYSFAFCMRVQKLQFWPWKVS